MISRGRNGRNYQLGLIAGAGLLLVGCGSRHELGQVRGVVRSGGQPLPNVLVTFVPVGKAEGQVIRSMGKTDSQGHYELRTEAQAAGAVVGKYRVIVEDLAIYSAPRDDEGSVTQMPPVRFPARFSDPLLSPIQREVKVGEQVIELDLDDSP